VVEVAIADIVDHSGLRIDGALSQDGSFEKRKPKIENRKSATTNHQSPIGNRKLKTENRKSATENRKSTMKKTFIFNNISSLLTHPLCFHIHSRFAATFPQPSFVFNDIPALLGQKKNSFPQQSAIENRKPKIGDQQSTIENRQ